MEKVTLYSKRLIKAILLVFGDEDPTAYGFRTGDKKMKIERYHTNAVYRKLNSFESFVLNLLAYLIFLTIPNALILIDCNIHAGLLKLLPWKKVSLRPLKYNSTYLQPMGLKYVERTFQKMLVHKSLATAFAAAKVKQDVDEEELDGPEQEKFDTEENETEEAGGKMDDKEKEIEEAEAKKSEHNDEDNGDGDDTVNEDLRKSYASQMDTSADVSMELPNILL